MDDEVPVLGHVGPDVVGAPVVDGVDEAVVGQVVPGGVHPPLTARALVQQVDVLESMATLASLASVPITLVARTSWRQSALGHPPGVGGAEKQRQRLPCK